ncbi:MAG: hypothetical protein JXA54_01780 [Candidatus Heimdallarchaeota archaeon]|nr:hypothetical protein [Candidatus Heimdallarchaeota archaeon]
MGLIKPLALCLVQVGKKGLEIVDSYPKILPKEIESQIAFKCMPFGAKDGDFLSANITETYFSGYVFRVPEKQGRDNLASLVVVFDTENYNPISFKKVFSLTLEKLAENNLVTLNNVQKLLPEMFNGITKGKLRIKISSIVMLEFDFEDINEKKDKKEEIISQVKRELW